MTAPSSDSAPQRPTAPPGQWSPPGLAPPPGYAGPPGSGPPPGHGCAGPPGSAGPPPHLVAPAVSPAGQPLASFGDRLLAYLIDAAVFVAATMALVLPTFFVFLNQVWFPAIERSAVDPAGDESYVWEFALWVLALQAVVMVLSLVIGYFYYVEFMLRSGQTLGKKVVKLKVVPVDPAGSLTRGMAARRYLAQFVAGAFIPAFSYVDGLWQLWDKPYQQCLHDKFARTLVVKVAAR